MPNIAVNPIHLGLGASADAQPEFSDPMRWYADYSERTAADGPEGRLVSWFSFSSDWDSWEMHPNGAEVVLCISGNCTIHQEHSDGRIETVNLRPGDYAINPPGTWHTADTKEETTALFITAGQGTEHRMR